MNEYDLLEDDELDDVESDLAEFDDELDDELAELLAEDEEARRRRRRRTTRRPVQRAKGGSYYRPRPPSNKRYVTQTQLKSSLSKVQADVRRNAAGIKTLNSRVAKLSRDQTEALRKERVARKAEIEKLRSGQQFAALLPALLTKTVTVKKGEKVGDVTLTDDTKFAVAPDMLTLLLPTLLAGDSGKGGDSSNMLVLALALGGGLGK